MPAPYEEIKIKTDKVRIKLSQHIGTPAVPCVKEGEKVKAGQVIAAVADENLGAYIHASIDGTVENINEKYITVREGE